MQDTIKSLWNGYYTPGFETVDYGKEASELFALAEQLESKLTDALDEEAQKILEKYKTAKSLLRARELEGAFAKGFSMGMTLTYEATVKKEL